MKKLTSAAFCAALAGCVVPIPVGITTTSAPSVEAPLPQTAPAIASFDRQFAAFRAENGLGPLRSNAALDGLALAHSRDMRANNYVSHVDRQGKRAQDRARASGVTRCGVGENIAQGQKSPEEALAAWMASPGHRANLLNPNYASYGIGRDGDYWTLVFTLAC